MPIRRLDRDPRTPSQKQADARVQKALERGDFLGVAPSVKKEAITRLRKKHQQARDQAARLGFTLGEVRRALRITQEHLAQAVGTQKTNVSRLESGRYGGLSIESFYAVCSALQTLSGTDPLALLGLQRFGPSLHIVPEEFRKLSLKDCLETAGTRPS